MPGVNNINTVNALDSKKVVSKLSFKVGEVFQGKVVGVANQANEVVLRTTEGWQFIAKVKSPLENMSKELIKFKVVGYEDGKLQISVVPNETKNASIEEKSIETILKQQNLSSNKEDLKMLMYMVKHGIPLTKENISSIKTITDFKEKISENVDEEDAFINKYLQSKGIDINSEEGKNINQLLKGFFSELKKSSVEELITLKENGIEITENNLKSFSKVFKEDTGLYKQITQDMIKENVVSNVSNENHIELDNFVPKANTELKVIQNILENDIPVTNENINIVKTIIDLKEGIISQPKNETDFIKQYLNSKGIPENSVEGKVLINNIKEFFGTIKNELIKEVLAQIQFAAEDKIFNKQFKEDLPIFKEIINDILKKDIPVTKENIDILKTVIDLKEEILSQPKNETEVIKQYLNSKSIPENSVEGKVLINSIKEFFGTIKSEPIKEVLAQIQSNAGDKTQGLDNRNQGMQIKSPALDEKNFSSQFKEDLPVLKDIIKSILQKDIPATKENTDIVKTIIDLKEEILSEPKNENTVIKQYLENKNIPENSLKGKALINDIKEFFGTIKNEPIKEVVSQIQFAAKDKIFSKEFKEDLPVFKEIINDVLKKDIPITRENIDIVKTIIDLKEEILSEPKNENTVIKQYLENKNIPENSLKGKALINDIKEFFGTIRNEPIKEVVSQIQFAAKDKIFSKQFKEDLPVFKEIINDVLKKDIPITRENIDIVKTIIDLKEEIVLKPKNETEVIKQYLDNKNIPQESMKGKILINNIKEFFRTIKNEPIKEVLAQIQSNIGDKTQGLGNRNQGIDNRNLGMQIKSQALDEKNFSSQFKEDLPVLKDIIKNVLQKDIPATKENIDIVKTIIDLKEEILSEPKNENTVIKQYLESKNIPENSLKGKALINDIKEFFGTIKNEPIKEVVSQIQFAAKDKSQGADIRQILDNGTEGAAIKNQLPDEKIFSNQFKEDLPVFKEIINDVLKKDIPITKENMDIVKTIIDLKEEILLKPKNETEVIKQYLDNKNIPQDSMKGKALINNIKEFFGTIKNEPIKEVLAQIQSNVGDKTQGLGNRNQGIDNRNQGIDNRNLGMQIKSQALDEKNFSSQFKEDLPVLKDIIKNVLQKDIPVTKENIDIVKTVIDLKEEILLKPKNENSVIKQYLDNKNIPENSLKGKALINDIKEFFGTIKNEPIKEVVSQIQFAAKDKIQGADIRQILDNRTEGAAIRNQLPDEKIFSKEFKEDLPVFKEIINDVLKKDIPVTKENIDIVKTIIDLKEEILLKPKNETEVIKQYLDNKNIPQDSMKGKVLINNIKEFFGIIKNEPIKEVLAQIQSNIGDKTQGLGNRNQGIDNRNLGMQIKSQELNEKNFSSQFKEDLPVLKDIIKNVLQKDITAIKENIDIVKTIIDLKEEILSEPKNENTVIKQYLENKNIPENSLKGKALINDIKEFFGTIKNEPIKEVVLQIQFAAKDKTQGADIRQILDNGTEGATIKNQLPDEKIFSKQFKEDLPVFKEIINDVLKKDIPITKENIDIVKTIIDLKEEVLLKPKNEIEVIKQYLDNKNIPQDSMKGKALINNIKEFFGTIKNEPIKEVLAQIQSNIGDKTQGLGNRNQGIDNRNQGIDNRNLGMQIKSQALDEKNFSSQFKEDLPVLKDIIKNVLQKDIPITKENIDIVKTVIDLKEEILSKPKNENAVIKQYLDNKNIPQDSTKGKELINNIKEFFGTIKNEPIKEVVSQIQFAAKYKIQGADIIQTLDNRTQGAVIKNQLPDEKIFSKQFKEDLPVFKEIINDVLKKDIPITKENMDTIKTIIDLKEEVLLKPKNETEVIKQYLDNKNIPQDSMKGKALINNIKEFFETIKNEPIKEVLAQIQSNAGGKTQGVDNINQGVDNRTQGMQIKSQALDEKNFSSQFKEDLPILKDIIKNVLQKDIPITKENIDTVKTVIDLKEEILSHPKNETEIIKQYLDNKNIPQDSIKGKELINNIKEFFGTIKNEPIKEVLSQIQASSEDKTQENFAKQFKQDLPDFKTIIKNINRSNDLTKNEIVQKNEFIKELITNIKDENWSLEKNKLVSNEKVSLNNVNTKADEYVPKANRELKVIQSILENDIPVTKENINTIKTIIDLKEEILLQPKNENEVIKQYLNNKNIPEESISGKMLINNMKEFFSTIKNESIKEILSQIQSNTSVKDTQFNKINEIVGNDKNEIVQKTEFIKDLINSMKDGELSLTKNNIPVTKENIDIIKTITDLKQGVLSQPKNENEVIKQYLDSKNIPENSVKGKELISSIKEFFDGIKKEPIKEVLSQIQLNTQDKNQVTEGRNKGIEGKNQGVETKAQVQEGKSFDKQFKEDLPIFKEIIKNIINGNELAKSVDAAKGNGLAENIKSEIAQKTDFMKDIINSIKDGDWSLMKSSINDIKVFNTVSNQYYYIDIPINVNQRQYECKLLIKDDRKKGKKIDSKNVKMFVSVKTINMGKVDAYIKVSDRNVNVDLKCNENWIKVFQNENQKLISALQDMNYNVSLKVEKQVEEADIVTTREFFQDNSMGSLNIMV